MDFDLENIFSYHAPTPEKLVHYNMIREAGKEFAEAIIFCTPKCADQTVAIRLIREAVMLANAAIALMVSYTKNRVVKEPLDISTPLICVVYVALVVLLAHITIVEPLLAGRLLISIGLFTTAFILGREAPNKQRKARKKRTLGDKLKILYYSLGSIGSIGYIAIMQQTDARLFGVVSLYLFALFLGRELPLKPL